MCGIFAMIAPSGAEARHVVGASAAVRHRGPDDEGYVLFRGAPLEPEVHGGADTTSAHDGGDIAYRPFAKHARPGGPVHVALGHQRLSIIDLSAAGHQPMCSPDSRVCITYNGEIYNYLELREELRAKGSTFASESDTEVILAAWREWGSACLERLNGMFAFVLLDRAQRRVFAARDRFGVKPLYYWVAPDGTIAFASEIKQFSALPGWEARLNGQRAYDFLAWGLLDHTDETLFRGVHQLRGGERLELALVEAEHARPGERLRPERWYAPRPRPFSGTLEEAGAEFRRLLADSIRLRLRSDVPVGSCLSGGLDSSSIVCIMNLLLREQGAQALQKTFSVRAREARFDEGPYIDAVVRHTAVDPRCVYPSLDELFPALEKITWHQDEPFGSTSIYAQWHVFRLAAESGVEVMLDGQGADEQLAGYHGFFAARFGALARGLRWVRLFKELTAASRRHGYPATWGVQQLANNVLPEPPRQALRKLVHRPNAVPGWLDLARLGAAPGDPYLASAGAKPDSLRAMSLAQLTANSLPMLLHWEDRDSMAHSVEARVPFLDYRLVEFVLGLPDEYKLSDGVTKRVLREGMRGVLPESVRTRMDKLGFVTPEELWVREQSPDRFRRALREAVEVSAGILRPAALDLLERVIADRRRFSFLVWRMVSFGTWLKVFGVRV